MSEAEEARLGYPVIRPPEGWALVESFPRKMTLRERWTHPIRERGLVVTFYNGSRVGIYPVKSDGKWSVLDPRGKYPISFEEAWDILSTNESIEETFFYHVE